MIEPQRSWGKTDNNSVDRQIIGLINTFYWYSNNLNFGFINQWSLRIALNNTFTINFCMFSLYNEHLHSLKQGRKYICSNLENYKNYKQ